MTKDRELRHQIEELKREADKRERTLQLVLKERAEEKAEMKRLRREGGSATSFIDLLLTATMDFLQYGDHRAWCVVARKMAGADPASSECICGYQETAKKARALLERMGAE